MSIRRMFAVAVAALTMAGCVSGPSYAGSSGWYPNGAYEYDSHHSQESNRYFRRGNVTCDRVRDICYDRFGISYLATKKYLGKKEANRAYKKYGNQVFLFSPKPGVICDRRTESCSSKQWTNGNYSNWSYQNQGWQGRQDGTRAGAVGSNQQPQQRWPRPQEYSHYSNK